MKLLAAYLTLGPYLNLYILLLHDLMRSKKTNENDWHAEDLTNTLLL